VVPNLVFSRAENGPYQERHSRFTVPLRIIQVRLMHWSGPIYIHASFLLLIGLLLSGCAAKKHQAAAPPPAPPPPVVRRPVRSRMPPRSAQVIEHCVVIKQENANTVSCACIPLKTKIDSKTGHTTIICKRMPKER
jgi:hypothetical protein